MKNLLTILLASTAFVIAEDANDRYTQLIYQTEYGIDGSTITEYLPTDVEKSGTIDAEQGVQYSSRFELHCIDSETSVATFLADQLVTAYLPDGSITITSLDPKLSYGMARTRVDQPYTVDYTISGIIEGDDTVQEAARSVHFDKDITTFALGEVTLTAEAEPLNTQSTITSNGDNSESYENQLIAARSGMATYSLSTLVDFDAESSSLSEETIFIWPLASGTLDGVVEGETYSSLPLLTIDLTDIYPLASAKLRITNLDTGDICVSNEGQFLNSSEAATGNNYTVEGSALNSCFPIDGDYQIELIEDSEIFGIRVLDSYEPFSIKRAVLVNGHFTSGS